MPSSISVLSTTSSSETPSSTPQSSAPAGKKRRDHRASTFYSFCTNFVQENLKTGRRYRTDKQGIEAATLRWNLMTEEERELWRQIIRERRANGEIQKVANGDRGDPCCDPTFLGRLNQLSLKFDADKMALEIRWDWTYNGNVQNIGQERFLIVNAISDFPRSTFFAELAVVEFSLENGITDCCHSTFRVGFDAQLKNQKYALIRRVLNWPSKIGCRLNSAKPVFFAIPGQLASVFNALTFVDRSDVKRAEFDQKEELNLSSDLSTVNVLSSALAHWLKKPDPLADAEDIIGGQDCLVTAKNYASRIIKQFSPCVKATANTPI